MLGVLGQFRHRRFRRDLSAYLDDMLSERARRRLEAHLDSCEACRQELAELRVTVEALGSLPMAEAPRSFTLAAAPVAEVRPRPAARRLEFGLRLATATAAFALALVVVGDFAGLPGGGDEEGEEMWGEFFSGAQVTPEAMEAAPAETLEPYGITEMPDISETPGISDVQREELAANETPAAEETPTALEAAPAETPAAEETPPALEAAPAETPAAEETPPAPEAAPVERPAVGVDVSEEEPPEKAALEEAEVEEEAEAGAPAAEVEDEAAADAAGAQAVGEEEDGGLSREEVVRWLEIGLGAGVVVLVVIWAFARFQRSIGNRP